MLVDVNIDDEFSINIINLSEMNPQDFCPINIRHTWRQSNFEMLLKLLSFRRMLSLLMIKIDTINDEISKLSDRMNLGGTYLKWSI